jgi:phage I-like protein
MIRQTGKVKAVQMLTISEAKKVIIGMQRVFAGAVIKAMDPASLDNDIIESKRELYQRVNSASNEELEMIYKHSQTNGKMND